MIAWRGNRKYKVTISFEDGPLAGTVHSWKTDRDPVQRITTEWGTYVQERQVRNTFFYRWQQVQPA